MPPFQLKASIPFLGHVVGIVFFSPFFGLIFCCSCLDPLKGSQDWFVTLPARKPAASSLLCLPHLGAVGLLPGWWGYCSACAVVTLDSWLWFLSITWLLLLKNQQQAGLANWRCWLYISQARLMQGMQCCSDIIIFLIVGSRGSCHLSSSLREALPMESVRESHKNALSQEPMMMLGVWRRKQEWFTSAAKKVELPVKKGRNRVLLVRDLVLFLINHDIQGICKSARGTSTDLSCSYSTGFLLLFCVSIVGRDLWNMWVPIVSGWMYCHKISRYAMGQNHNRQIHEEIVKYWKERLCIFRIWLSFQLHYLKCTC